MIRAPLFSFNLKGNGGNSGDGEVVNTAPEVHTPPTIANAIIEAPEGKQTAKVEWTEPVIIDKEDGVLK